MLNMTNAQLHQCVHCSRVGDYDLIIPFTLSLSARTTPSKVPVTTCSSSFHRPEAVKGRKGPVNGRFALAWLLWLPEQKTQPHKQRAIQLNYFRPHFAPKKKKNYFSPQCLIKTLTSNKYGSLKITIPTLMIGSFILQNNSTYKSSL